MGLPTSLSLAGCCPCAAIHTAYALASFAQHHGQECHLLGRPAAADDTLPLRCSTSHSIVTLRGPGEFISEISLLQGDFGVWQTNVVARTDVQALLLTKPDVKNMLRDRPEAEADVRAGGLGLDGTMWQNQRLGVSMHSFQDTTCCLCCIWAGLLPVRISTEGFSRVYADICMCTMCCPGCLTAGVLQAQG